MADIVQRLMDFDRYGLTPGDRVSLREQAAIEIFSLRRALEAIVRLTGDNDFPASKIARAELSRSNATGKQTP